MLTMVTVQLREVPEDLTERILVTAMDAYLSDKDVPLPGKLHPGV